MKCPKCEYETRVVEEKVTPAGNIRRERVCRACAYRFRTIEVVAM